MIYACKKIINDFNGNIQLLANISHRFIHVDGLKIIKI